jgi:hypothetical protein
MRTKMAMLNSMAASVIKGDFATISDQMRALGRWQQGAISRRRAVRNTVPGLKTRECMSEKTYI